MPRHVSQQILSAASVSAKSAWFELTDFGQFSITVRASTSVASLVGTVTLRGTNNSPQDPAEPALTNGIVITALPSGVTHASGVITYASPGIGISSITLAFPQLPQFILADYVFTSGGGTVALTVQAAGWTS
jgi:hypothetical protein